MPVQNGRQKRMALRNLFSLTAASGCAQELLGANFGVDTGLLYPLAHSAHVILEFIVGKKKVALTSAEIKALKSVLRYGEAPLEFITSAINLEIARREGRPRRGLKAPQILVTPQHEALEALEEIEIIASERADK